MITMQRSRSVMESAREAGPTARPAMPAAERIELGRRVCDALASENRPAGIGEDLDLSAVLAAYATVCRRADYAHRRAAVAHFARQLRQR